jgi:hypothetical protein
VQVSLADPAWVALFTRADYLAHNAGEGQPLRIEHHDSDRLAGVLSGVVYDDTFTSGWRAPCGGPDFARERETPAVVAGLVAQALDRIEASTVRIHCRPSSWSANEGLVQFALLNAGFTVESCDLSFAIDVRGMGSAEDYLAALKSPARRALRHLEGEPFGFSAATGDDEWARGWALLEANRSAKGRSLSIDGDYVEGLRRLLPEHLRMWLLCHDGREVAAALVYRVLPDRDLVVAWGDAGHDLPRSPMNILALRVAEQAIAEGRGALDLGTSTLPGPGGTRVPNDGLVQFKQSIGARPEPRLVLVREAS